MKRKERAVRIKAKEWSVTMHYRVTFKEKNGEFMNAMQLFMETTDLNAFRYLSVSVIANGRGTGNVAYCGDKRRIRKLSCLIADGDIEGVFLWAESLLNEKGE